MIPSTEFSDAMRLVRSSLLWQWSSQARASLAGAAQSSSVVAAVRRVAGSSGKMSAAERLQVGAAVVAIAASMQGVVVALAPASVTPAVPGLWLVVALSAAIVAASAPAQVKAWPSSRCRVVVMAVRSRLRIPSAS